MDMFMVMVMGIEMVMGMMLVTYIHHDLILDPFTHKMFSRIAKLK